MTKDTRRSEQCGANIGVPEIELPDGWLREDVERAQARLKEWGQEQSTPRNENAAAKPRTNRNPAAAC